MNVIEYLKSKYGISTYILTNRLVSSVGTSVTKVIPNDPSRVGIVIVNTGDYPLYLSFDNDVSVTKGIYVAPNGGNFVMNVNDDFTIVTWELWGICDGGESDILTIETVII